ncbi:MAG TPA: hypothetical protein VKV40_17640 [Ktedonobacteraceae bacterium]|nr:hypothetical protein [Ktedonobacteraceae bacterium]
MQQNTNDQNQTGYQNPVNARDRITTNEPMSQVEMDQCIQDCIACSDACLQSASTSSDQQHAAYLRDCSELCLAAAHFMQHQNPLYGYVVNTAAEVTQRTGEHCEQKGDTNAANACKNASWSLGQVAKMVAY